MTQVSQYIQVSAWRRFVVSLAYSLATVVLSLLLLTVLTSQQCYAGPDCDKMEQVIYAVVALSDLMISLFYFALGSQGMLPGARRRLAD